MGKAAHCERRLTQIPSGGLKKVKQQAQDPNYRRTPERVKGVEISATRLLGKRRPAPAEAWL